MTGTLRRWSSWVAGHQRELVVVAGLAVLSALAFVLRWEILAHYPYPPSNDVGGDLYSAQQWLGNPIPGLWVALQPPLYYWLVVIPAVHFLGPFTGPKVYIALVPALLVFPGYAFCRETGARTVTSAAGAFGFAMATTMSLMVTWNGAYNALGILFLAVFATFLVRALKGGRTRDAIASGVALALVGGTHELTFLIGAIAFVVSAVASLALSESRRATLRTVTIAVAAAVVCFLPLIPIYTSTLADTANNGVGGYQSQLVWAYTVFPTFAWGFQGPTQSPLALVDVAVSALGLLFLWTRRTTRTSAIVLSSIWIGGLAVSLASASNAVRGLYFLTLPATLVVPSFFDHLRLLLPGARTPLRFSAPIRRPRPRLSPTDRAIRFGQNGSAVATVVVVSLLVLTYFNAAYSLQNMEVSTRYYMSLSSDTVAALKWLAGHTNQSDHVMDTAGVQTWIWGLSHRLAYAPTPLGLEATTASMTSAQQADFVWLGTHLAGNSQLTVADNTPSWLGVPNIFVNVPGYWQEMVSTQAELTSFSVRQGTINTSATLATANLTSTNSSVLPSGAVRIADSYWWNLQRFGVNETVLLNGSSVRIQWTGWNATVLNSAVWFGLPPPTSPYVTVVSQASLNSSSVIENHYQLDGNPFTLTITGGGFHQRPLRSGWAYVWCNTTGVVALDFGGLPAGHSIPPFVEDTSSLVHSLGIGYFLASPNTDLSTYHRLVNNAITAATAKEVFRSGSVYVFHLTFS